MQQPNINLKQHGTQISCESCSNITFKEVAYVFKVSKILTGESQDSIVPVSTFECAACGHINKEFSLPEEKKNPTDFSI